jgi:hypothetical protein
MILRFLLRIFILITTAFLYFTPATILSQECPFGIENCKGGCGRWIDADGDGICDRSLFLQIQTDSVQETIQIQNQHKNNPEIKTQHQNHSIEEISFETKFKRDTISDKLAQSRERIGKSEGFRAFKRHAGTRYNLIFYSSLTIGAYFLSLLLLRLKVYSKKIHRRIWNVLLLLTFLISCLLGLFLVVQINYKVLPSYYLQFLKWHVDFGIGMALISIFHIIWHFTYFKNIFKKTASRQEQA